MPECHVCGRTLGMFPQKCRICGKYACKESGHLRDGVCIICEEKIRR